MRLAVGQRIHPFDCFQKMRQKPKRHSDNGVVRRLLPSFSLAQRVVMAPCKQPEGVLCHR